MSIAEKHCWAEIDLDALAHNYHYVQSVMGSAPICAVVKADAYGHGDIAAARLLAEEGAAWFAVSSAREAVRLRKNGIEQPILILGYTEPELAPLLAKYRVTASMPSYEWAEAAGEAAQQAGCELCCHIKLDTGMGRLGFALRSDFDAAIDQAARASHLPGIRVTGVFQHFASADSVEESERAYTGEQHRLFSAGTRVLRVRGLDFDTVHCCNSAGLLTHPEWGGNLVRAGIILYGANPSAQMVFPALRQVMTLKAMVTQVKQINAGGCVSYGRTYRAEEDRVIATVAAGYADGYPRLLSNKGLVDIRGYAAPVVGRVCMDQLMVDVTEIPGVCAGDTAVLFGPGGAGDNIEAAANKSGLITYEILSQINRRVPRVYLRCGQIVETVDYLE